jgi:hypothetical protein
MNIVVNELVVCCNARYDAIMYIRRITGNWTRLYVFICIYIFSIFFYI